MRINWVDIVVIIILLRTSYTGYSRGLLAEIFRMLAMIGAFVIARRDIYATVAEFITVHSLIPYPVSLLIGYSIIVVGGLLFFNLIGWVITGITKLELISVLERFIGLALGMVRGLLFVFIVMIAVDMIDVTYMTESVYKKSFLGQYLIQPFEVASSWADEIWGLFQKQS